MPLTLAAPRRLAGPVTTLAAAAAAFAGLTDAASEGDGVTRLDPYIAADVLTLRTGALTAIAHTLTFLGSEIVVSVAALLLLIALLERRGARYAGLAALAMGLSAALTVGIKLAVGRDRPGIADRLGPVDHTYSFPSGHTLNSAVLLGLVCLLAVPLLSRPSTRVAAWAAAALLAVGVGSSRVYLGYHWTTDVLASWMVAIILLTVVHVAERSIARGRSSQAAIR
jgi:membrane-associated phospholipid phosphatase